MPLKNWTEAQRHIHSLYIVQHQTLRRVKELMLRTYGFDASIRAYRDKLKEWGYLRREIRQQDAQLQPPPSGATDGHMDAALPSIQSMGGIFGGLPEFNIFPNSLPQPSESQGLWPNPPLHGNIPMNSFGQGSASFTPMSHSDASAYSPPSGSNNANLNTRDSSGRTLLHQAVISRSLKDVEKYLSMGLAVDAQDNESNQPLHHAAKGGSQELVRLLLKHKADPNAKGETGRTALHMSIRFPKAMKEILKTYPEVSSQDDNGDTPLHLVLTSSKLDERPKGSAIEKLILAGANVNKLNADQTSPFHLMLEKVDSKGKFCSDYVVIFLENNTDIFLQSKGGKTPFEIFLQKTAEELSLFGLFSSRKWDLVLKMFIAMKADINITLKSGMTLVHEALYRGLNYSYRDYELVRYLLTNADVSKPDSDGNYPLHYLARYAYYGSQENTLKWTTEFLRRGAKPNSTNDNGVSPLIELFSACEMSEKTAAFANLLLQSGANPMIRDSRGDLPIYYVAKSIMGDKKVQLIETLLKASTPFGSTPQRTGSLEMAPKDQKWWDEFHRLYKRQNWSDPTRLLELSHLLPTEVVEVISSTAHRMLAKNFLQQLKPNFDQLKKEMGLQDEATQIESYQIRVILRDCLNLKIELEQSWYHSLLEHFD